MFDLYEHLCFLLYMFVIKEPKRVYSVEFGNTGHNVIPP